jgi:hypothetical protein
VNQLRTVSDKAPNKNQQEPKKDMRKMKLAMAKTRANAQQAHTTFYATICNQVE